MIQIQCFEHKDKNAIAVCLVCHKGLCEDCQQFYQGKSVCKECLTTITKNNSFSTIDEIISDVGNEFSQVQEKLNDFIKEQKIEDEMIKFKNETFEIVDDIHSKFFNLKISRSEEYGYLICDSCSGYYKLKKGESLEDFECCECGGKLRFKKTLN